MTDPVKIIGIAQVLVEMHAIYTLVMKRGERMAQSAMPRVAPPSTTICAPVTKREALDAR